MLAAVLVLFLGAGGWFHGPAETSFVPDHGATGVVLVGHSMGGLWPSASCTSRSWRPRFAG